MAQYAPEERDWERLARESVPDVPRGLFEARFALAIETIIVGLRTPLPTPGAAAVKVPTDLHARAEVLAEFVAAGLQGDR